eukprot:PLAT2528.2.p1 GENE.PLAT2528.2~~PLAT2528.2.p1  ORF type:complete len:1012 (-),score=556.43 PLAT2528.2:120-3155(-)
MTTARRDAMRAEAMGLLQLRNAPGALSRALGAFQMTRKLQGDSNSAMLTDCLLLAKIYTALSAHTDALSFLRQAHDLISDGGATVLESQALARACGSVAELYLSLGEDSLAEDMFLEYLEQVEASFGTEHAAAGDCYATLSAYYTHRGEHGRALLLARKALAIRLELLGASHETTGNSHYNLALLYRMAGEYDNACEHFEAARRIHLLQSPGGSLILADIDLGLGFAKHLLGDLQAALQHYQTAYYARKNLLGAAAREVVQALHLVESVTQEIDAQPMAADDGEEERKDAASSAADAATGSAASSPPLSPPAGGSDGDAASAKVAISSTSSADDVAVAMASVADGSGRTTKSLSSSGGEHGGSVVVSVSASSSAAVGSPSPRARRARRSSLMVPGEKRPAFLARRLSSVGVLRDSSAGSGMPTPRTGSQLWSLFSHKLLTIGLLSLAGDGDDGDDADDSDDAAAFHSADGRHDIAAAGAAVGAAAGAGGGGGDDAASAAASFAASAAAATAAAPSHADDDADSELPIMSAAELHEDFEARRREQTEVERRRRGGGSSSRLPSQTLYLLDSARALSLGRAISRLGRGAVARIMKMLHSMDVSVLAGQVNDSLLAALPVDSELRAVAAYRGSADKLGYAERVVLQLAEVPRLPGRVAALRLRCTFEDEVESVEDGVDVVARAAKELRENELFHHFLAVMVDVHTAAMHGEEAGALAGGGSDGGSGGGKLSEVVAISRMRTADGVPLLQHLVERVLSSPRAQVLYFLQGFTSFDDAAVQSLAGMREALVKMQRRLRAVLSHVDMAVTDGDEAMAAACAPFLDHAQAILSQVSGKFSRTARYYKALLDFMGEVGDSNHLFAKLSHFLRSYHAIFSVVQTAAARAVAAERAAVEGMPASEHAAATRAGSRRRREEGAGATAHARARARERRHRLSARERADRRAEAGAAVSQKHLPAGLVRDLRFRAPELPGEREALPAGGALTARRKTGGKKKKKKKRKKQQRAIADDRLDLGYY